MVKPCLLLATGLLTLLLAACGGSPAATATLVPTILLPTATPTPLPTATLSPTHTPTPPSTLPPPPPPPPSPTPTPVIPRACPPPGDPDPPQRPVAFDDYAAALAAYLSAGGSAPELERLLRDWGAITGEAGAVRALEMTGDMDAEVVVALVDPAPEVASPFPAGDVLIFQCQQGAVVPVYRARAASGQASDGLYFSLVEVADVNGTGRADVVYIAGSCGAHTCWERLHVVEWGGTSFVERAPGMPEYPYPTFALRDGHIQVDAGNVASAGAGLQRSYSETWHWTGRVFTVTEQVVGPPTALVHYIHDGDAALAQGEYGAAIGHYQAALDDTQLPPGLFLESEEQGTAVVKAYARFKMVVAYAASGDGRGAQAQYDLLLSEHPEGTPGQPYVPLAQAFWGEFVANEQPRVACAAAVALAQENPPLAENLYAGYANPAYEVADFCRVK